jgi:hypothetical protein
LVYFTKRTSEFKSKDIVIAIVITNIQVLVFNKILHSKESRILGYMADTGTKKRKEQVGLQYHGRETKSILRC